MFQGIVGYGSALSYCRPSASSSRRKSQEYNSSTPQKLMMCLSALPVLSRMMPSSGFHVTKQITGRGRRRAFHPPEFIFHNGAFLRWQYCTRVGLLWKETAIEQSILFAFSLSGISPHALLPSFLLSGMVVKIGLRWLDGMHRSWNYSPHGIF